jgi:serine/threonine protein kinase
MNQARSPTQYPAENLIGALVADRWRITNRLNGAGNDTTGGFFSIPYEVVDVETGRKAFMKVLNIQKALTIYQHSQGISLTEALHRITEAHLFECHLAEACANRKMTRVVRGLDHGHTPVEISGLGPIEHGYIVFELGVGDTHHLLKFSKSLDLAWTMKVLHQAAVGVQQLHLADIAHQDLKRSNVVFFDSEDSKLADLGRAVKRNRPSNNDARDVPCQPINSPTELIYGFVPSDWDQRHFSTDLYMLGNLAFSMLSNLTITTAVLAQLPVELRPRALAGTHLGGSYQGKYSEVVPFLKNALDSVLAQCAPQVDICIREKWTTTISQLCEPDPEKRGHPRDHAQKHSRRYSAERFISAFREMEMKAAITAKK